MIQNSMTSAPTSSTIGLPLPYALRIVELVAAKMVDALRAYISKDYLAYWHIHDQIRRLRAELSDLIRYANEIEPTSTTTTEHVEQLKIGLQIIRQFDAFYESEKDRYREGDLSPALVSTREEANWLIEYALLKEWNFEADYLVVIGMPSPALFEALIQRDVRRWCFYSGLELCDAQTDGHGFHSIEHLSDHLKREFVGAFPKSFSICSVADESLNDEKRHEVAISSNLARIDVGSSVNTIDYFAEALLWQGIGNLPFIFESVHPSCLVDIYRNAPALIVSPGPSLDRNIHLIPSIQNQVLIVAVAQALKALHSVGVTPHIICVVDPQDLRTLFEGVPVFNHQILFLKASCHPAMFRLGYNRICVYAGREESWIGRLFGWPVGGFGVGTVSISALELAAYLQVKSIALVGQDLAITDGKRYTALQPRENEEYEPLLKNTSFANRLLSYDKEHYVPTTTDLFVFHHYFEKYASEFAKRYPKLDLINATEGGAYIAGFRHVSLEQFIVEDQHSWSVAPTIIDEEWDRLRARSVDASLIGRVYDQMYSSVEAILDLSASYKAILVTAVSDERRLRLIDYERRLVDAIAPFPFFSMPVRKNMEHVRVLARYVESEAELDRLMIEVIDLLNGIAERFLATLEQFRAESLGGGVYPR